MKFFIINTESFSPQGTGSKRVLTDKDLPEYVQLFLQANPNPFIILDESSKIKTTQPCGEGKKSTRCRLIKRLAAYGQRCALTGTLMSKSPLNVMDQYQFLDSSLFPESMYELAERYCVMETLPVGRGRRVMIPETSSNDRASWRGLRNRMLRAFNIGGESRLALCMSSIYKEYSITGSNLKWIYEHDKYTPFRNVDELKKRLEFCTATIRREDVMDISKEKFIRNPMVRKVRLSNEQKNLYNQFVKLGFTDRMVLGTAPALELTARLMDICNGYEPVSGCIGCTEGNGILKASCPYQKECTRPKATYEPLKENPKVDAVMELLDEIGTDDNQVVIWSARRNLMDALSARLEEEGISCCLYTGSETEAQKKQSADDFESGKARVCIANPASAGYGVNFMKKCSYAIYACMNNSVEMDWQSRSRLLRGELKEMKYCYRIVMEGSVEERIYSSLDVGNDLLHGEVGREVFELK